MKEHEKRCKVTVGHGISFPSKRQVRCSSHLGNAGNIAESLDFSRFSAFFIPASKLGFAECISFEKAFGLMNK